MWKTKCSRCVYESPSGYKVCQNLFYRWLTLGSSALQTVINRWHPEKPVLHYLPMLTFMVQSYPGKSCLLGLGGAGIPHMLPEIPLVAVDNSEEVIDIAKHYFMLEQLNNISIVHDNAINYLHQNTSVFSHVLVDLYNANHFPPECNNTHFFAGCKKILKNDGFLALNLANTQEQWPIFQLVKNEFKYTLVIPVKKSANMIIIAANMEHIDLFINKIKATKKLKRLMWDGAWGLVGNY